jgi:hypothetical protein
MAAPPDALAALAKLLGDSLDPRLSRDAARALEQGALQPGFAIALLQLSGAAAVAPPTRLAAATCFKNHVRRHWVRARRRRAARAPPSAAPFRLSGARSSLRRSLLPVARERAIALRDHELNVGRRRTRCQPASSPPASAPLAPSHICAL